MGKNGIQLPVDLFPLCSLHIVSLANKKCKALGFGSVQQKAVMYCHGSAIHFTPTHQKSWALKSKCQHVEPEKELTKTCMFLAILLLPFRRDDKVTRNIPKTDMTGWKLHHECVDAFPIWRWIFSSDRHVSFVWVKWPGIQRFITLLETTIDPENRTGQKRTFPLPTINF